MPPPSFKPLPPRWLMKPAPEGADVLAQAAGLNPIVAALLVDRGIDSPSKVREFLVPRLASLGDPLELPGMKEAVQRLFTAIDVKHRVILYGDYDVDGVTSMSLMHLILKAYCLPTHLFLPHRMEEGYGLSQ